MKFYRERDRLIGDYIMACSGDTYEKVIQNDENLDVASYLSELANGMLGWYSFRNGAKVLQIGSWFGAHTEMLCSRCEMVTIIEDNAYRADITKKRLEHLINLRIIKENIIDYSKHCTEYFDYVIFAVDEKVDEIPDPASYAEIIHAARSILSLEGKMLIALPNRLGAKYLCGAPDPNTGVRFDGITENSSELYRFERAELFEFIKEFGFPYIKMYYLMPDHHFTQMVYTDEYKPRIDVRERLHLYSDYKTEGIMDERCMVDKLAHNDVMHIFANSFLVEAGNVPCSQVIYSAVSSERDRERAFATNILKNGTVEKVPLYLEGKIGIRKLIENTQRLAERGIPVLKMENQDGKAVMACIQAQSLSLYLRELVKSSTDLFIDCIDKLRDYIWKSSETVPAETNCMREISPNEDWGLILEKAYIEMIPVNCFYVEGEFLFYDQEFTVKNCPAGYVLFRALRDMYAFAPEIETLLPLKVMKERYGLSSTWDYYQEEEEKFQTKLRKRDVYKGFYPWVKYLDDTMKKNRKQKDMRSRHKDDELFDSISDLDGRRIILFGSGRYAENYLDKYGKYYSPIFLVDNNPDRWGSKKRGIEIKNPKAISKLMRGTYRVVIAIKDYGTIIEQLIQMGIREDSYRIFSREIDSLLGNKINNAVADGKYHIGFVEGTFNDFSIADMDLLKKCKKRSAYLIAGVLTDELSQEKKGKRPQVSFEERLEMVSQCKYVDRVIPVGPYDDEITIWKELRYGCLFEKKENKAEPEQIWLQRKLYSLGSMVEYL